MAVSTVEEYLSALEKSKLLGSEQLVQAQRLAAESADATALAKALGRENLISRWQAGILLDMGQRAQLRLGKYKLIQPGQGGHGHRLSCRARDHESPRGPEGRSRRSPRTGPRWSASSPRPGPSPRSITPISSRPIASTMKWTAISSSWSSSTARTCNGWSNSTARWPSIARRTTFARRPRAFPTPTPATSSTATSSPRTCWSTTRV